METQLHNDEQQIKSGKRRRKIKPIITFIVDSREQLAFDFTPPKRKEFDDGGTLVLGLKEGDYTVALDSAQPLSIRVERKSEGDLFGVCGFGRERFEKELERLRQYEYRALVIECSASGIYRGFDRSQIPGKTVMASVLAWSVQFGVHVIFAGSRSMARAITQRLLEQYAVEFIRKTDYVPPTI
jgi:ERCC4-type nuclease